MPVQKIGGDYLVIVTQNQAQNWNFETFITSLQEGVTEFTVQWQFFSRLHTCLHPV